MVQWLITGGCGFIGRNLIRQLLQQDNVCVRVVDDLTVGTPADLESIHPINQRTIDPKTARNPERLDLFIGDIRNAEYISDAMRGVDVVVHLAANTGVGPSIADPRSDCLTNVIGTLNCLEACRTHGIRRFVFASSGATLGNCSPPLHEALPARPVSPYGASKLAGEGYCSAYHHSFGIDTVVLRFGNCYGPLSERKSSVVAKFIHEALAGEPWQIFGDGNQTRDFIYVDDIAQAIMLAAETANIGGEIFQIATNCETTVSHLARELAIVLQRHQIQAPQIIKADPLPGEVTRNFSNTQKARSRLGWSAQISLSEGLERTVRWFIQSGRMNGAEASRSGVSL